MSNNETPNKRQVGRKATINREDIIAAALRLAGPHRSISSLSLREITREAGIAPNSFYRHFKSPEELAIAVIELSGETLRKVIGQARVKAQELNKGIVRMSVETFMKQLYADGNYLPLLLREGVVGSDQFKATVRQQLAYFEQELTEDLVEIAGRDSSNPLHPKLIARAITQLVFAMGAEALDRPYSEHRRMIEEMVIMIKMLITGAHTLAQAESSAQQ